MLDYNNEMKVEKAIGYDQERFMVDLDYFEETYPGLIGYDRLSNTIKVFDTIPVCPTGSRIPYFHMAGSEEFLAKYGKLKWFVDGDITDPTIYAYTKTGRLLLLDEVSSADYNISIYA
ncbi:hypothetical protein [Deinococcus ficus]|uniref:hypothetical protein n=1 Tax=Deinococcus ficus TaxID=317577 RepID=UPI0003B4E789|nr:hypothetical protein [Deinococcus ficus]